MTMTSGVALGNTGAEFSECGSYRYKLWRLWEPDRPRVMFVMLNPSTATDTEDDPTIRRCIGFARSWGYGGLYVGNLFAYRTPSPKELKLASCPIGSRNGPALLEMAAQSEMIVAAWGSHGSSWESRVHEVYRLLPQPLHCLKQLDSGQPAHPLYQPKDLKPLPLEEA